MNDEEAIALVVEAARFAQDTAADRTTGQLPLFMEASDEELDEAIERVNTLD